MDKQLDSKSNYDRNVNKFFGEPRKSQTVADTFVNLEKRRAEEAGGRVDPTSGVFKKDAANFYGMDKFSET